MTCIVGMEHEGCVYLAGDSAGSNGWETRNVVAPKVFKNGKFVIGCTTSFRMMQLLKHTLAVPVQEYGTDLDYMVTHFAEEVRNLFKEQGFSIIKDNEEKGGCFLVGYNGNLYVMQEDFSILQHTTGYDSVGCGANYALGSLYSSTKLLKDLPPQAHMELALQATTEFSSGVQAPYHFIILKPTIEKVEDNASEVQ